MKSLLVVVLMLLASSAASAQSRPDSVKLRNDCRLATQVLTTGNPAPHIQWASWAIRRCPDAADVVVRAVGQHRRSSDTLFLNAVTAPASEIRDRGLYEVALSVMTDRTASNEARVFAARMLAWLYLPNADLTYRDFVDPSGAGDSLCIVKRPPMDLRIVRGTLLPQGWSETIKAAARTVYADVAQPGAVREAAQCFIYIQPSGILRRDRIENRE
jgi:hypothetical protein